MSGQSAGARHERKGGLSNDGRTFNLDEPDARPDGRGPFGARLRPARVEAPDWQGGRPLRVCHLAKFYSPAMGGIETHMRTLAQAQARMGLEVRVVCVNHRNREGAT